MKSRGVTRVHACRNEVIIERYRMVHRKFAGLYNYKVGLSDSEHNAITTVIKTLTVHDYEYYHDSYIPSISVHKYYDQRNRNKVLSMSDYPYVLIS